MQLCRRPIVRSSIDSHWIRNHVCYDYSIDEEYVNFLNDKYGYTVQPTYTDIDVEGDYVDYICVDYEGSNIVNLQNYLRLNGYYYSITINSLFLLIP